MKILSFSGLFIASLALAHGEDKPGPHQGHVRMPGAFHTELVPVGPVEYKIYLLDIGFQNPTTERSVVTLRLRQDTSEIEAKCSASKDFFSCKFPEDTKFNSGALEVKASRLGSPGATAQYKLPLEFTKMKH